MVSTASLKGSQESEAFFPTANFFFKKKIHFPVKPGFHSGLSLVYLVLVGQAKSIV
jgi:hypothetical protein